MQMLATAQAISNARILLAQISTPIVMVLGNIGEILNIIIFAQRTFRKNACAIYFLVASFTRLFFINFTILLDGLSFGMLLHRRSLVSRHSFNSIGYNIDPSRRSLPFCKIKFYLFTVTSIIPPSLIVLACIDRFLLSSPKTNVRAWSQPRMAYRLIAGVSIFWMLLSIHTLVGSNTYIKFGQPFCLPGEGSYSLFVALYWIICIYLLPSILMIIFGLLTIINVRQAQRRIQPTGEGAYVRRKDRHLLRMLSFQVLVTIIFTIPRAVFQVEFGHQVISQTAFVYFTDVYSSNN